MRDKEYNQAFIDKHMLPDAYLSTAKRYFDPVAEALISILTSSPDKSLLIALSGSQGSGKSTLTDYLACFLKSEGVQVLTISLDDFYLSKAGRAHRAATLHPLLETRGVPGTHDTEKLQEVLAKFKQGALLGEVIPSFDKSKDDLKPKEKWHRVSQNPQVLILEGWCLGVESVEESALHPPCNKFESERDSDGNWRRLVNRYIQDEYAQIHRMFDYWLFLQAPSFESVYSWRLEQEEKMRAAIATNKSKAVSGEPAENEQGAHTPVVGMTPAEIHAFIQYYQRLTERVLASLADKADVVWKLDDNRKIVTMRAKGLFAEHRIDLGRVS
jgi:D-glycerate 3-kinase